MTVRWNLSQGEGRFGFRPSLRSQDRRLPEDYQQASPDSVVTWFTTTLLEDTSILSQVASVIS
jgi:hypothetical protein